MDNRIRVDSNVLKKYQDSWSLLAEKIKNELILMKEELQNLEQVFTGNPAKEVRKKVVQSQQEEMEAVEELGQQLERLTEIIAVYEQTERRNTDVTTDD